MLSEDELYSYFSDLNSDLKEDYLLLLKDLGLITDDMTLQEFLDRGRGYIEDVLYRYEMYKWLGEMLMEAVNNGVISENDIVNLMNDHDYFDDKKPDGGFTSDNISWEYLVVLFMHHQFTDSMLSALEKPEAGSISSFFELISNENLSGITSGGWSSDELKNLSDPGKVAVLMQWIVDAGGVQMLYNSNSTFRDYVKSLDHSLDEVYHKVTTYSYDKYGRISTTQEVKDGVSGSPDKQTTTFTINSYNSLGQVSKRTTIVHEQNIAGSDKLDKTTVTVSYLLYDTQGRVKYQLDRVTSDESEAKTTVTFKYNQYDKYGEAYKVYKMEMVTGQLYYKLSDSATNVVRDSDGNIISYQYCEGTDCYLVDNIQYDENGNIISFDLYKMHHYWDYSGDYAGICIWSG